MIVVAIVLILTAWGIFMSRDMLPRYRTRDAAMSFASHVELCQNLAVRSNKECSILLVDYDDSMTDLEDNTGEYWVGLGNKSLNSTTWDYLPVDTVSDTTDDASVEGQINIGDVDSEHYSRRVGLEEWETIAGPGAGNEDRIVFSPRGFLTNPATDFTDDGVIVITFVNKVVRANGQVEDFTVSISRAGMARVDSNRRDAYDGLSSGTSLTSSEEN
jgi:Tfp pilus assembly protein FimT